MENKSPKTIAGDSHSIGRTETGKGKESNSKPSTTYIKLTQPLHAKIPLTFWRMLP
jgi:hypothetical protein